MFDQLDRTKFVKCLPFAHELSQEDVELDGWIEDGTLPLG